MKPVMAGQPEGRDPATQVMELQCRPCAANQMAGSRSLRSLPGHDEV